MLIKSSSIHEKTFIFNCDNISVEFDAEGNVGCDWGWSFVISAIGPIFEVAEVFIDLATEVKPEHFDASIKSDDWKSAARPPSRCEQRPAATIPSASSTVISTGSESTSSSNSSTRSGYLEVPYASSAEICIDRSFPGNMSVASDVFDVNLTYIEGGESKSQNHKLRRDAEIINIKLKTNRVTYAISPCVDIQESKNLEVEVVSPVSPEYPPLLPSQCDDQETIVDEPARDEDGGWNCPTCTMFNLDSSDSCVACERSRNGDSTENRGDPPPDLAWWCGVCTFANRLTDTA